MQFNSISAKEKLISMGIDDIPLMEYGLNGACIASAFEDVKDHAQKTYGSIKEMDDEIL
ncbi:MAG: hypothetical protein MJ158_00600 [Alphaproteobacteria bacterium]|nr:hypothetical protein [Alphaproteobacteria bacterium]